MSNNKKTLQASSIKIIICTPLLMMAKKPSSDELDDDLFCNIMRDMSEKMIFLWLI